MSQIVTLTMNPAVDKSTITDRVLPDRKLRCRPPRREPGGGGLNVSRALRRLGWDSLALFVAGGPTGQMLRKLLEEEGVGCRPLETDEWTRENLMVREEGAGDHQFRFDMPGPELSDDDWSRCLEELRGLDPFPDYLVASGSLPPGVPPDFYARVADVAREMEAKVVLDTSGEALERGIEKGVYLLKPNLRELEALTGRDLKEEKSNESHGREGTGDEGGGGSAGTGGEGGGGSAGAAGYEEAQVEAARTLVDRGAAEVVVVSMGSAGALLVTGEGAEKIPTPTVRIRSRVGAGDSMVAGLVLGMAGGLDSGQAARLGVAAGAAAVMTRGSELCRRGDVENLFTRLVEDPGAALPKGPAAVAD